MFNGTGDDSQDKPETFASILRRVSVAVQKEYEQKTLQRQPVAGMQNMQTYPAIVGADQASFHFLLDPFNTNAPLYAPNEGNHLNTIAPTDDSNSVMAANFAGLVGAIHYYARMSCLTVDLLFAIQNGLDDFFEMGNNDRYNFNLWSLPTAQTQAPNTQYMGHDVPEEETSRILRQLMGFEPSYQTGI